MTVTTVLPPDAPDDQPPARAAEPPRIRLTSPTDLAIATPFLLRFHPVDSVVVLAFQGKRYRGIVRTDLPEPPDPARPQAASSPAQLARRVLEPLARRGATAVAILGYGPSARVDPVVPVVRNVAERWDLQVSEAMRVDAGRWWSYSCANPDCCPPEGTPFDPASSEVAAACAVEGLAALPSRADLERWVGSPEGAAEREIAVATDRAAESLLAKLASVPEPEQRAAVQAEGRAAVAAAIARYQEGGRLADDELASLTVLLSDLAVRDVAWQAITTEQPHLSLWMDVVRRADPALVAPPASLLAFTAWRAGDCVLAGLALERALRADPGYYLANMLQQCILDGIAPDQLDGVLAGSNDGSCPDAASSTRPDTGPGDRSPRSRRSPRGRRPAGSGRNRRVRRARRT